jgi:hypothetical protein
VLLLLKMNPILAVHHVSSVACGILLATDDSDAQVIQIIQCKDHHLKDTNKWTLTQRRMTFISLISIPTSHHISSMTSKSNTIPAANVVPLYIIFLISPKVAQQRIVFPLITHRGDHSEHDLTLKLQRLP